jgi:hypothetical protein
LTAIVYSLDGIFDDDSIQGQKGSSAFLRDVVKPEDVDELIPLVSVLLSLFLPAVSVQDRRKLRRFSH